MAENSCVLYPLTCGAPAGSLEDVRLGIVSIALFAATNTLLVKFLLRYRPPLDW
jgi:hypothetical protein